MRALVLLLSTLSLTAAAQVYKGIGPDGRPFYSDRPVADAQLIQLPRATRPPPRDDDTPGDAGTLGSYDAFEVVSPKDADTIRSAEGAVSVSLLLDPPLMDGHRLLVEVDGVAAAGQLGARTQLQLRGLTVGSHRLVARVLDDAGNTVAATPVVNIHLREPLPEGSLP